VTAANRGRLSCRNVVVTFGGLVALRGIALHTPPGSFTGLVGPNGSGKSTLLNAISGVQAAESSEIDLDGHRLDALPPHLRARRGVARTFQSLRLFDTLSVLDNICLGAHTTCRHSLLESCFHTPRSRRERRRIRDKATKLLEIFGDRLTPRLDDQVVTLSYANRRRVEIARCLMSDPSLVLLDEPTAGMNPAETEELSEQLPELASMSECSMIIVEHKMDFIEALCPTIYVLDHGVCLTHGTPDEVKRDPMVIEAFLGIE
jgi:ABC-type branched-subunit amino acid transport system ATPase component